MFTPGVVPTFDSVARTAPYQRINLNQGYDFGSTIPPPPYSPPVPQHNYPDVKDTRNDLLGWLGLRGGPDVPVSLGVSINKLIRTIQQNIAFILLCGLWYMSSAISSNTGKSIMNQFRFPVTLTIAQFAFVSGYSAFFCVLRGRPHSNGIRGIPKPNRAALKGTLMMCLFQIGGHVFTSMAIARVPVSTVHTIKALSPLFTVMTYAILFRVRYSAATYWALLPLTSGVMLVCSLNMRANAAGLILSLGSTMVFVSQNIYSKKLLPKDDTTRISSSTKLDKLELLLFSSGMAFVLMIPIWMWTDGAALAAIWAQTTEHESSNLLSLFLANGAVHFLQNLIAFSLLSMSSPVTYSIASLLKRIFVICMAIVWFGQPVTLPTALGIALTGVGLFLYNQVKNDVQAQHVKHQKRESIVLPTSKSDQF